MAQPLRQQLREKVAESRKRATAATVADRRWQNEDGPCDAAPPAGEAIEMPATAPQDPSAVIPRLRALEQGTSALEHRVIGNYEEQRTVALRIVDEQADTNMRLSEAIARLAAKVGVAPSDLGL
jgi:hypothetical protein